MKSKIVPPTADINEPIPNNRLIEVNGNQPPFAFVGFFLGGGGFTQNLIQNLRYI